jgi:hypothetical protein
MSSPLNKTKGSGTPFTSVLCLAHPPEHKMEFAVARGRKTKTSNRGLARYWSNKTFAPFCPKA